MNTKLPLVTFKWRADVWGSTLIPSYHLSERERSYRKEECCVFITLECSLPQYTGPSDSRGRAVHNIQGSQSQIISCQCESVDALEVVFCV